MKYHVTACQNELGLYQYTLILSTQLAMTNMKWQFKKLSVAEIIQYI